MCGIAAHVGSSVDGLVARLTSSIAHHGPDGQGEFVSGSVDLRRARLAIVDFTGGAQPMFWDGGNLVILYNGEIYTLEYIELGVKLERIGAAFETQSDTEVVPLGYNASGPYFFQRLIGIVAFALVDVERRSFLVCDHFSINRYRGELEALCRECVSEQAGLPSDAEQALCPGFPSRRVPCFETAGDYGRVH